MKLASKRTLTCVLISSFIFTLLTNATVASADANSRNGAVIENGVIFPIVEKLPLGQIVTTPCNVEIVHNGKNLIHEADIVIDPGHGGRESGSVGSNGLVERDLNLTVAFLVEEELKSMGYSVFLTRRSDLHMPIRQRTDIAKSLAPKAFVSIHHNGGAVVSSSHPGTETFHQNGSPESKRLAGLLYEEISNAFSEYWVPWVATAHRGASSRLSEPGRDAYGILRYTPAVPSVIIEAAYLSNPPEAELLAIPEVQKAEAVAIAVAINRFITTSDPGSGFKPSFIDGLMTGTGSGRGCVDPKYATSTRVTVGYKKEEFDSLISAAKKARMSIEEFQIFGVHALDLFLKLDSSEDDKEINEVNEPEIAGSNVSVVEWSAESQVALARVGAKYDMTASQVQKLGATLMVFLTSLAD